MSEKRTGAERRLTHERAMPKRNTLWRTSTAWRKLWNGLSKYPRRTSSANLGRTSGSLPPLAAKLCPSNSIATSISSVPLKANALKSHAVYFSQLDPSPSSLPICLHRGRAGVSQELQQELLLRLLDGKPMAGPQAPSPLGTISGPPGQEALPIRQGATAWAPDDQLLCSQSAHRCGPPTPTAKSPEANWAPGPKLIGRRGRTCCCLLQDRAVLNNARA
mmetsp:Transcript_89758/g.192430  ORF Transcript_89758/g.192430 Transcript_89758/m.192430 type:complete len:219 (-) Transcript_89758:7-663(-)